MKGNLAIITSAVAMGLAGTAAAAPLGTYQWTDTSRIGAQWEGPEAAVASSNIIYLNNCSTGCTLSPGQNNAPQNRSSIVNQTVNIPAYSGSAAQWDQIVNCVKQTYAPFNVQIVTTRPAAGTNYHMAIVAGRAQNAGMQSGVLGVSPFSCGYIPNAISFTFANESPNNILELCWTVAQETAHSWGLDHKYDNRDPMTYLSSGPAMKTFQNSAGSCGEYNARQCQCTYAGTGSSQMNSYALIQATFGLAMPTTPDTTLPTVTISSPTNGAQVQPGFTVTAAINDNIGVAKAELRVDNVLVGTKTSAPWTWTTSSTLGTGTHRVSVTAYDAANNQAAAAVDVSYAGGGGGGSGSGGGGGTPPGGCTNDDDCQGDDVCSSGTCVAGPEMPGGLGTPCATGADCASGQCGSDGSGNQFCVDGCDPANTDACPDGFQCVVGGGRGVCWPNTPDGEASGGCSTGGGNAPGLLLLGLGLLFVSRRQSRRTSR